MNVKKSQTEKKPSKYFPMCCNVLTNEEERVIYRKKILPGNDVLRLPSPPNPAPSAEKFQSFKISVVAMIFIK